MAKGLLVYLLFNILALSARYTLVEAVCDEPEDKQYDLRPDPSDCKNYFECGRAPGSYTEKKCPHGTGFNEDSQTCMWRTSTAASVCFGTPTTPSNCNPAPFPDAVYDKMRDQCVLKWTLVMTSETMPDCSELDASGKYVYKDEFIADPTNCAGYYLCKDGVRLKGSCDAKLFNFDPLNQYCVRKENLPCSVNSVFSNAVCEGEKAGTFVADPNICTAYFRCTGNDAGRQEFCDKGLYFSEGSCVSKRPSRCSCEDAKENSKGEYAHEDPTKFWICDTGMRTEMSCPKGTKWSQADKSCLM